MVSAFKLLKGDTVLLVGEGNFSFSSELLNFNDGVLTSQSQYVEIISTCKEAILERFSNSKQEAIKLLIEKDVQVIFSVDATSLKTHPALQNKKFTKVIFNFPHVGGKMKINLNRKLLKDFFSSASDVLDDDGCIVVTLCDGQGGTQADKTQRRWDDCWQVTEMAAESDLILHRVEDFDVSCFPNYVNVGFRSCDKSFISNNAVVHVFKRQCPPTILIDDPYKWAGGGNLKEDLVFDFLNARLTNPVFKPSSASSFILDYVKNQLISLCSFYVHTGVIQYHSCSTNISNNLSSDTVDKLSRNVLDIFNELKDKSALSNIITSVLELSQPIALREFSVAPVQCQILVFTKEDKLFDFLEKTISELVLMFNFGTHLISVKKEKNELVQSILISSSSFPSQQDKRVADTILLPNQVFCHRVYVDQLAQVLFQVEDWRCVWSGSVSVDSSVLGPPIFKPISLFSKSYAFDVSLSVPLHLKAEFDYKFFLILWLLAGDLIVKTEHISTYLPTERDLICYCYRITYKSYNTPLFRKRVIFIHEKVIAKFICEYFKIKLR